MIRWRQDLRFLAREFREVRSLWWLLLWFSDHSAFTPLFDSWFFYWLTLIRFMFLLFIMVLLLCQTYRWQRFKSVVFYFTTLSISLVVQKVFGLWFYTSLLFTLSGKKFLFNKPFIMVRNLFDVYCLQVSNVVLNVCDFMLIGNIGLVHSCFIVLSLCGLVHRKCFKVFFLSLQFCGELAELHIHPFHFGFPTKWRRGFWSSPLQYSEFPGCFVFIIREDSLRFIDSLFCFLYFYFINYISTFITSCHLLCFGFNVLFRNF